MNKAALFLYEHGWGPRKKDPRGVRRVRAAHLSLSAWKDPSAGDLTDQIDWNMKPNPESQEGRRLRSSRGWGGGGKVLPRKQEEDIFRRHPPTHPFIHSFNKSFLSVHWGH